MTNRFLIGIVIVLGAVLIFENAYLLGRRHSGVNFRKAACRSYRPENSFKVNNLPDLYRTDPFAEMNRMQARMDRMFKEGFEQTLSPNRLEKSMFSGISTSFNDPGSSYVLTLNLPPDLKSDAVKIQIKDRQLIVQASDKKETGQDKSLSQFSSSFFLPEDAKIEDMKSDYKNNILTIAIPKIKNKKIKK